MFGDPADVRELRRTPTSRRWSTSSPTTAPGSSWPAGCTTAPWSPPGRCGRGAGCAGCAWPDAPAELHTVDLDDVPPDGLVAAEPDVSASRPAVVGWRHPPLLGRADRARRATHATQKVPTVTTQTNARPTAPATGTAGVKRGMAEMLKGGVIMDVVTAEQAKIAEDAGAVAVMALERVPADIRAQGGVSRMSDPDMIDGIIEAVSIPVMAKARIGHFAEAQVLQSLGVDYIDESEVLTPADYANHIDKWAFTVPFVCGATNLGEALRRITEGAAMIRSKGEAGTGDVSNAVTHMRTIRARDPPAAGRSSEDELYVAAKELQAPYDLVKEVAEAGKLPVVLFTAGGIATPADAAMMMQLGAEGVFVGSGIFKSGNPAAAGRGDRQGHHVLRRPRRGRQGLPRPRRGDGRHQRRRDPAAAPARRARLVDACRRAAARAARPRASPGACVRAGLLSGRRAARRGGRGDRRRAAAERDLATADGWPTTWIDEARDELRGDQQGWPDADRLRAAAGRVRRAGARDVVVLQGCEDHWAAKRLLDERDAAGTGAARRRLVHPARRLARRRRTACSRSTSGTARPPTSLPATRCSTTCSASSRSTACAARFDEGRIEVDAHWQQRIATDDGRDGRRSACSRCRATCASTCAMLERAGARRRRRYAGPPSSTRVDGIVMPGGESTTMSKLARTFDLFEPLRERLARRAARASAPAPG